MSAAPRVTVLMSVFDGAPTLREAMDSILGQTFADFELVVVDDGSADATPSILDSYPDRRIVRLRNPANIGLTRSLNLGLAMARGEYVARQDADDISRQRRLEKQVAFLDRSPVIAAVGTDYVEIDATGRELRYVGLPAEPGEIADVLLYRNCLCHGATMLRTANVVALGGYDERFKYAQDWDLWLRMAERFKLANLSEVLYECRRSPSAVTASYRAEQRRCGRQVVETAVGRRIAGEGSPASSSALARSYFFLALEYLADDQPATTHDLLRQASACDPAFFSDTSYVVPLAAHYGLEAAGLWPVGRVTSAAVDRGIRYVDGLFRLMPPGLPYARELRANALGQFLVAAGFAALDAADTRLARIGFARALIYNPRLVSNRGVLSGLVKASMHRTVSTR